MEKILGCPFKYADIPRLYGKRLEIVCVGQAENMARNKFGIIRSDRTSASRARILDLFEELDIYIIGYSDLLKCQPERS